MSLFGKLFGKGKGEDRLDPVSPDEFFADPGAWEQVASSWLHSVSYLGQGAFGTLQVRFKDKKTGAVRATCHYENVPVHLWQELISAASHGTAFHRTGLYGWPYKLV